jgi:hypothetical protein
LAPLLLDSSRGVDDAGREGTRPSSGNFTAHVEIRLSAPTTL